MPLPNSEVICALFESYINIREYKWHLLNADGLFVMPTDSNVARKVETCKKFLEQVQRAKTINDWIQTADDLEEHERIETTINESANHAYFGLSAWFRDEPLLLDTIRAVRYCIISQIKNDDAFTQERKARLAEQFQCENNVLDVRKELNEITAQSKYSNDVAKAKESDLNELLKVRNQELNNINNKLHAFDDSTDYLTLFFNDVIKKRDVLAKKLKEETFKDFESHVADKSRKRNITKLILGTKNSTNIITEKLRDKSVTPVTSNVPVDVKADLANDELISDKYIIQPSSPHKETMVQPPVLKPVLRKHRDKAPEKEDQRHVGFDLNRNEMNYF